MVFLLSASLTKLNCHKIGDFTHDMVKWDFNSKVDPFGDLVVGLERKEPKDF